MSRRHKRCGKSPGGGNGNLPQYSCLENSMEEEPDGLQSMGSQRVRHNWTHAHTHTHSHRWLTLLCSFQVYSKVMVIHWPVSILFQILFMFRLLYNTEQSSMCYTVDPCWLSILNIAVCTCQSQTQSLISNPQIILCTFWPLAKKACLLFWKNGSFSLSA